MFFRKWKSSSHNKNYIVNGGFKNQTISNHSKKFITKTLLKLKH